jgi:UDP-N-acetylmuramoyl-tripeptide--D-alanyl-D-alanine ligase
MAAACHGQRISGAPDTLLHRICTDSRQVQRDDLFLALRGERFDGHAFVAQAVAQGAAAVMVETERVPSPLPACGLIGVRNTRVALGEVAARYRRDFDLPIVAVGGSNGKTTTKELLAAVLSQKFKTLASPASFNNDVGVPTTLLELAREHEVAVLEFGTNHPGELAPLLQLAQPRYGVLTSIGREHLEFFGSLEGVVREEGSLAEVLPANGKLFLNGDTPAADEIVRRCAAPVIRVGLGPNNAWRAQHLRMQEDGMEFEVETAKPGFARRFRIPLLGPHQVVNGLLALAVAGELGLTPDEASQGLAACKPAKLRLQLWNLGEVRFLDDSYNANADSMRAALDTLRQYPCRSRRVAVLGQMAELGAHAASAHEEIGRHAASVGVDHLIGVGSMARVVAQAARAAGLNSVEEVADVEGAAAALRRFLRPQDVVLLKASRAAALDRIGELLRAGPPIGQGNDMDQQLNSLGKR